MEPKFPAALATEDDFDNDRAFVEKEVAAIQTAVGALLSNVAQKSQKVTITSAQLKALKGSRVAILPAPGVGKYLVIVSASAVYKFGTVPYTVPGGLVFILTYGNAETAAADWEPSLTGFLDQSVNKVLTGIGISLNNGGGPYSQTLVENEPIMLEVNGSANVSDGDGTLDLTIGYIVVDL